MTLNDPIQFGHNNNTDGDSFFFIRFAIAIAIKPNYVISATKQQFAR
jgi:hypothetical protein